MVVEATWLHRRRKLRPKRARPAFPSPQALFHSPPRHLSSLPLQEHLRGGVDLTHVERPVSGASSPGASAFKLPGFPAAPLPPPDTVSSSVLPQGEGEQGEGRSHCPGWPCSPPHPLACAGAQASLPQSSRTLPAESLLGVLLGPPRAQAASHEASKAVRRTREGASRDAGWWAPKAQAPVGVFTALDAKGNVCVWGPPRGSCWSSAPFLPGGWWSWLLPWFVFRSSPAPCWWGYTR